MTTYWQAPAGGLFTLEPGDGGDPSWTELSQTDWNTALSDAGIAIGEAYAANAAAACATRKSAYDALKASVHTSDWPESLFFFLTGFAPGDC